MTSMCVSCIAIDVGKGNDVDKKKEIDSKNKSQDIDVENQEIILKGDEAKSSGMFEYFFGCLPCFGNCK